MSGPRRPWRASTTSPNLRAKISRACPRGTRRGVEVVGLYFVSRLREAGRAAEAPGVALVRAHSSEPPARRSRPPPPNLPEGTLFLPGRAWQAGSRGLETAPGRTGPRQPWYIPTQEGLRRSPRDPGVGLGLDEANEGGPRRRPDRLLWRAGLRPPVAARQHSLGPSACSRRRPASPAGRRPGPACTMRPRPTA